MTIMSYYAGQQGQGSQYAGDEYSSHSHSTPHTPRDGYPQWEVEPQQTQESQEMLSQQSQSQSHSQSQHEQQQQPQPQHQQISQHLSFPPPPQPPLYPSLEDPGQLVPSQAPHRGAHDLTPIRLMAVVNRPPGRSPPVEIKPIEVEPTVRSTAGPSTRPASRARPHQQYHPYSRPTSDAGSSSRREIEAHQHVRFPTTPLATPSRQTFPSPLRFVG